MSSQIEHVLSSSLSGYKNLKKTDKTGLWSSVLRYIFRVINASEFASELREVDKTFSSKKTRLSLLRNGTVLKNIKLFTYASIHYSGVPRNLYQVPHKDEEIVLTCLDSDRKFRGRLRSFSRKGYRPYTLPKMDSLVKSVLMDVSTHTAKFVHKKLRFVIQSNGIEASDIKQDLYSWGAYSIFKAYPQIDSYLHAVNIAKRAIHNRGINLIMENTSQSRQRFVKHEDGTFGSKHVPLHSLLTPTGTDDILTQCNHMVVDLRGNSANGKSIFEVQEDAELRLAVQNVYSQTSSPILKRLMKLWSGQYDKEFSEHLGQDNDEWYEESDRKVYMCECVRFLGISKHEAMDFYKELKTKFKAYA